MDTTPNPVTDSDKVTLCNRCLYEHAWCVCEPQQDPA